MELTGKRATIVVQRFWLSVFIPPSEKRIKAFGRGDPEEGSRGERMELTGKRATIVVQRF
jgi:hypothetical protein